MSRKWTDDETEAFVTIMEEMVVEGHRADNGQFKPGTFQLLATKMLELFPTCGIDKKHAKNKHKRLKEKYQTAADMLNCSGFGWNDDKKCVEVDSKQVLDEWMKKNAIKFYTPGKPFPMFPRLEFVFGKDRANGVGALAAVDAVEEFENDDTSDGIDSAAPTATAGQESVGTPAAPAPGVSAASDAGAPAGNATAADAATPRANIGGTVSGSVASSTNTQGNTGVQQAKGKRKVRDFDLLDRLATSFDLTAENTKETAKILATAMVGQCGEKVGVELANLGFNTAEVVKVTRVFSSNPEAGKLFWGLTEEQREAFVRSLLDDCV